MTADDVDRVLKYIASNAKGLREAGVYGRVSLGEISFELMEPMQPMPTEQSPNPLDELPSRKQPSSFPLPGWPPESNDEDDPE